MELVSYGQDKASQVQANASFPPSLRPMEIFRGEEQLPTPVLDKLSNGYGTRGLLERGSQAEGTLGVVPSSFSEDAV